MRAGPGDEDALPMANRDHGSAFLLEGLQRSRCSNPPTVKPPGRDQHASDELEVVRHACHEPVDPNL